MKAVFSETVRCSEEIGSLSKNAVIGNLELVNSTIRFEGEGHVLYCEGGVKLVNSTIRFCSSENGLLYLSSSRHPYRLDVTIWNNSTVAFGKNCYFNGNLHAIASERQSIIVGEDCLMSFGIWLRTADPHLLYSCETHERINQSASIVIGDHVWLGQDAMILKGSTIGSGSILAAKALLSGRSVPSNQCWGGVPARMVSKGVFYRSNSVHAYSDKQTEESQVFPSDKYVYAGSTPVLQDIELSQFGNHAPADRIKVLTRLYGNSDKNRFAISEYIKAKPPMLCRALRRIWRG